MAALVEGHSYGLSSCDKTASEKSLIFVKLTDSALKSIEEFIRDKGSVLQPSIQFQSNGGVLRLPSNGSHSKSYGFTLSNVDADGPQGSFECLRQSESKSLESLGSMHLKMHINASEDSYEKTKVKMAAVEKENKKFCTKEIKPSTPYVGRKVKLKHPISPIPPRASSPSTVVSNVSKNGFKPSNSISITTTPATPFNSSSINAHKSVPQNKSVKNPDLVKQSIRERIIHLLAHRSYKKPELLARLLSEGIKDKDKQGISAILSQVAVLKNNTFSLANHVWNEVQENWRFYAPEEAGYVKTKKQQMLGGNSESRIPSPANVLPSLSPSSPQKRSFTESDLNGNDQRGKKQRISHYNRVESVSPNNVSTNLSSNYASNSDKSVASHHDKRNSNGCSKTNSSINGDNLSQKSPTYMNSIPKPYNNTHSQRNDSSSNINNQKLSPHRTSNLPGKDGLCSDLEKSKRPNHFEASYKNSMNKKTSPCAEGDMSSKLSRISPCDKTDTSDQYSRRPETRIQHPLDSSQKSTPRSPISDSIPGVKSSDSNKLKMVNGNGRPVENGFHNSDFAHRKNGCNVLSQANNTSSKGDNFSIKPDFSPESNNDSMDYEVVKNDEADSSVHQDYLKQYSTILNTEQRAKYKADFNAEFEEYNTLYRKIRSVASRFEKLQDKLQKCKSGSNEYFDVQNVIFKEYFMKRHDPEYLAGLKKLQFLHAKLSHIKKLVMEYDQARHYKS